MPKRGKLLNQFEQGQARALLDSGYSVAYVARRLKRSHNGIKKFRDRVGCYKRELGVQKHSMKGPRGVSQWK